MRKLATTIALALIAGAGFALGQGHVSWPLLAIIGGVAALRLLRISTWWYGLALFVTTHTVAYELSYSGTVPMPWYFRLAVFVSIAFVLGAVFFVQARANAKKHNYTYALVLPCGWASLDFVIGSLSPTGTWGSISYGFVEPYLLPVSQLASLTGWIGLTFVVGLLISMIDLLTLRRNWRTVIVIIMIPVSLYTTGSIRLLYDSSSVNSISVIMRHGPTLYEMDNGSLLSAHYLGWSIKEHEQSQVPTAIELYQQEVIGLMKGDASQNVNLVAWAEVLIWMSYSEYSFWVQELMNVARESNTTVAIGVGVYDPTGNRPYENRLLIFSDKGELVAEYDKSKATPGAWHIVGDGKLPVFDASWGRLSGAICFDFDFPALFHQLGLSQCEVVVAPSFDDKEVRHIHARMSTMRALEQGFTIIRPTAFGISSIVDPLGRVVEYKDAYAGQGFTLVGEAPLYDVNTVYPHYGKHLGYLFIIVFLTLGVISLRVDS